MLTARVGPNSIVVYRSGEANVASIENLARARAAIAENGYNGEMNERTAAKVRRYARSWFTARKSAAGSIDLPDKKIAEQFTFVTLTLPAIQFHSDNEIKRDALRPMLQQLGRVHGAREYLWKAEPQANGNIHFHILLDKKIPWQEVRAMWNGYMDAMGYIEKYRVAQQARHIGGFKCNIGQLGYRSFEVQQKAYIEGVRCGWSNPNSTDIHALNKATHVLAYITAYITKKADRRKIEGRIWDCSNTVRDLEVLEIEADARLMDALRGMGEAHGLKVTRLDQCTIYSGPISQFLMNEMPNIYEQLLTHWQGQQFDTDTVAGGAARGG